LTHIQIVKALNSLKPGAEWTLSGDNYEDLNWLDTGKAPTLAEIEAEIAALPGKEADAQAAKESEKAALLAKLGITDDEAKLLLS
jgi:hypothetical protein